MISPVIVLIAIVGFDLSSNLVTAARLKRNIKTDETWWSEVNEDTLRLAKGSIKNKIVQNGAETFELGTAKYEILNEDEQPEIITENQANYYQNLKLLGQNADYDEAADKKLREEIESDLDFEKTKRNATEELNRTKEEENQEDEVRFVFTKYKPENTLNLSNQRKTASAKDTYLASKVQSVKKLDPALYKKKFSQQSMKNGPFKTSQPDNTAEIKKGSALESKEKKFSHHKSDKAPTENNVLYKQTDKNIGSSRSNDSSIYLYHAQEFPQQPLYQLSKTPITNPKLPETAPPKDETWTKTDAESYSDYRQTLSQQQSYHSPLTTQFERLPSTPIQNSYTKKANSASYNNQHALLNQKAFSSFSEAMYQPLNSYKSSALNGNPVIERTNMDYSGFGQSYTEQQPIRSFPESFSYQAPFNPSNLQAQSKNTLNYATQNWNENQLTSTDPYTHYRPNAEMNLQQTGKYASLYR